MLLILGLALIAVDLADFNPSGLGLLGVVFLTGWLWLIGGFTRDFWITEGPEDLSRLDTPTQKENQK